MSEPVIDLRGTQHRYDTTLVLRDVDLTNEEGEIFGFLGHNGAGKTTAMNILTTCSRPLAGPRRFAGTSGHRVELQRALTFPTNR